MRFSPTGINLLGENHTLVRLDMVVPAVGSRNFIYEPFSDDDLESGSAMKTAYDTENAERFKEFGVDKEPDKKQFGAESLYPKIGYGLTLAIPYFDGTRSIQDLKKSSGYVGQPIQRYLKIAWAYAKDCKSAVAKKQAAKQPVPPKLAELVKVFTAVEDKLDAIITALPVDGWIGDEFSKPDRAPLLSLLAQFATAITEAMVELAVADPSSRLDAAGKQKYGAAKTSASDKSALFSDWRDFRFEDSVKRAAQRGVRYAGMGQAHLDHLKRVGLPANGHAYDMSGRDLTAFRTETAKLAGVAVKQ